MELLLAYLALGGLVAIAQGDWRLGHLVRAAVFWPARLPRSHGWWFAQTRQGYLGGVTNIR